MTELSLEEYLEFHPNWLQPIDIKLDVDVFEKSMHEYRYAFRRWGVKHTEYPRYGAPLVNMNGEMFNNPEPVCYPLDQWNDGVPQDEKIWDTMVKTPTEMLSDPCFDPLNPLKQYMLRSCILKWHNTGHFKPHTDTWIPSEIIRLWGTNDPDNCVLRFDRNSKRGSPREVMGADSDLVRVENVEAGRLYIIDTHVIHDAAAIGDNVFQFFIALSSDAKDTLQELIL